MGFLYERVGSTDILSVNTGMNTRFGRMKSQFVQINNDVKNIHQNIYKLTLNGRNVITTKTNIISRKLTVVTQRVGWPYQGIRRARLIYHYVSDTTTVITGRIDGKRMVPYIIRCGRRGCVAPRTIRFKDGTTLQVRVLPAFQQAVNQIYDKFIRLLDRALDTGIRIQVVNQECKNRCDNEWEACKRRPSYPKVLCNLDHITCVGKCGLPEPKIRR